MRGHDHGASTVRHLGVALCWAALLAVGTAACATTEAGHSHGKLAVVAAENTWGSLASQLGGKWVSVTSIITDPNADPHEYESSAVDARDVAEADLVLVNGAGYDEWASKLLAASPSSSRHVLDVARLVGVSTGGNPHIWYDPRYVFEVINAITAEYERLAPAHKSYFARRHAGLEAGLSSYRQHLSYIKRHFSGEKVAATESIFQYLASYLHLDLVTPYPFMKAVAEGTDPPASAVVTFENQIADRDFKVLVYNVQTVTPLTSSIKAAAAEKGIPVIGVSETIQPPLDTFQEWMVGELDDLTNALDASQLGK